MRKILELFTTNWKNEQLIKNMRIYAKKKKLNSKNPKYRTQAEIQAKTKAVDKKVFIAESNGAKVYAVFYK